MSESSADEPPGQEKYTDPAGRDVPAEDSPVPAGRATLPMGARVFQEPDRLVLRGPLWMGLPGLILSVLMPGALVAFFFWKLWGHSELWEFFLIAFVGPVVGMITGCWVSLRQFLLPRVTFDKEAGVMTLGWRGLLGRRPLSSIIGVQVMQTRKQFGGMNDAIAVVSMYQMNLILDDPAERRLNVLTTAGVTARSTARTVADFLGVPVLDSAGEPAAVSADALAKAIAAAKAFPAATAAWVFSMIPAPVVVEPRSDLLLIRPRLLDTPIGRQWRTFGPLCALLVLLLVVSLVASGGEVNGFTAAAAVPLGMFAYFAAVSLLAYPQARFDRARGEFTVGRVGRRAVARPLESVKAVETAFGPMNHMTLLLDDPNVPGLHLVADADGPLVGRTAERVASFLGVPLLSAKQATPAAAQSRAGNEAINPLELLSRTPLSPGRASIRGPARVVQKSDAVLVLRSRLRLHGGHWLHWVHFAPALIGIGVVVWLCLFALARFGPGPLPAMLGLLAAVVLFILLMVSAPLAAALTPLFRYRDHFDRKAGLLTLGWFGFKGAHPLAKILAVQLIPGGLVHRTPGFFGGGREAVSYQMNLVTADPYQERLHLTDDSDLKWTRQAGRQIADFFGVPLLDQIADGD